jgi:enoyl-CoA hydratase
MTAQSIELDVDGPIGWYRFNRPPRNAVDWTMLAELEPALETLLADPRVRVVVIGSAIERYFSTGADIASFRDQVERMPEWIAATQSLARAIRGADKPILAAIDGVAVGGGLEMAFHADLRFAASTARIGLPEVNIAFVPPVGGTQGLVRLVGRSKAFQMLYGGELMSAEEARACGLIDVLTSPDALVDEVRAFAEKLAGKPANALAAIRRCLIDGGAVDFDAGLAIEQEQANALARHPNFTEGIAAFLDKRIPRWS